MKYKKTHVRSRYIFPTTITKGEGRTNKRGSLNLGSRKAAEDIRSTGDDVTQPQWVARHTRFNWRWSLLRTV